MCNCRFIPWLAKLPRAPKPKSPKLSPLRKLPIIRKRYMKSLWDKCSHSANIMWVLSFTRGCIIAKNPAWMQMMMQMVISYLRIFRPGDKILRWLEPPATFLPHLQLRERTNGRGFYETLTFWWLESDSIPFISEWNFMETAGGLTILPRMLPPCGVDGNMLFPLEVTGLWHQDLYVSDHMYFLLISLFPLVFYSIPHGGHIAHRAGWNGPVVRAAGKLEFWLVINTTLPSSLHIF